MTAQKARDAGSPRSATATTPVPAETIEARRKPWKKKTPVEIVLDQIDRVREGVEQKEEELKAAKRQLEKLEQAKKLLEGT
jgi:hypothetical protein